MARFKLTIEYDGGPFHGWQRVDSGPSVQGALMAAAERLTGAPADLVGAGRTDSGVHAFGQVAHIDIAKDFTADVVRDGLNAHLRPAPISVLEADLVAADFHARFSAVRRSYWYRILNRRAPPALDRGHVWHVVRPLNRERMAAACAHLVGHHDFTTFRDVKCQARSAFKTLDLISVTSEADCVHVRCEARSFLHRQVRSMVGTIVEAGLGNLTPDDVAAALAARDRALCGPVAPASGLHLVGVFYGSQAKRDDDGDNDIE
jgi:tRNA pseudouridine38-40 synthase